MAASFPSLSGTSSRAFPLPTIPEDTLHYTLYPSVATEIDTSTLSVLITEYVESLLIQPWLWNKDAWELKTVSGSGKLEGRMRVGDSVDDEWCVVWLLREVSKKWKDLIISVKDSDGEFLLIEAANELPSWVSPDNAENRLWLRDGHLHLIPLTIRSSQSGLPRKIADDDEDERKFDPELSEEDGVSAVRTGKYRVDAKLEDAVWDRIACYPEALNTHRHRTKAWLPETVARALESSPELIQRAVEGFYVRDPSQLRTASRMSHFPPANAVLSSVLMTRAAYAQLQGQQFHPPRIFGPEWSVREVKELDDERRWRDLGVKIATGFQIMYKEGGRKGRSGQTASADESRSSAEYSTFIGNLTRAGFFGTELRGSAEWKKREEKAMEGWKGATSSDTTSQRPSFAYQVDRAIEAITSMPTESLQITQNLTEDSESWLEVSPDELDGMMMRASGQARGATAEDKQSMELGDEHGKALGDLAKKVEEFVGGEGDMAGARFVDELSDDDMDEDDDDEVVAGPSAAEREERMKNLVAPLTAEEWGRKATDPPAWVAKKDLDPADFTPKTKKDMPHIRPPRFEKQTFDGVESDSEESDSESDLPPPGTLGRKIAQMKWGEGAPKIEELEDEDEDKGKRKVKFDLGDDLDQKMQEKVWGAMDDSPMVMEGDGDVDMAEEEEEFIKFTRDMLGIDEAAWANIVSSRKERGAFVPEVSASSSKPKPATKQKVPAKKPVQQSETASAPPAPPVLVGGDKDMSLDSFDKVMAAMDAELAKRRGPTQAAGKVAASSQSLPSMPTEADLDDLDDDDLEAMDRELKAALKSAGIDDDELDGVEEAGMLDEDGKREFEMMRSFLESYKAQNGGSGVVGNLFGRLGKDA